MNERTAKYQEKDWSPAMRWGLGLSAILTAMNRAPQNALYRGVRTDDGAAGIRYVMQRDWGIQTREEYLNMLQRLRDGMHNPHYMRLHRRLSAMSEPDRVHYIRSQQQDDGLYNQLQLVHNYLFTLDRNGIAAWDQGRYVSMCQWGATTGVLAEDEALDMIMTLAREVQPQYQSWYQYGISYVAGRQFWRERATTSMAEEEQETLRVLLGNPQSPWRLDWNTPLDGPLYS